MVGVCLGQHTPTLDQHTPTLMEIVFVPLNDRQVRSAVPREAPYKLGDSGGLFLLVTPAGGRVWRFKYRHTGREKLLTIGPYPRVGLAAARLRRDQAKEQLSEGKDPSLEKQSQKRAAKEAVVHTFEQIAREWHETQKHDWTEAYARQVLVRLEVDVFPELGQQQIGSIEPKEMLRVLKRVEARGVLETTRRLKQYCSAIFRYAIACDYCRHDPAAPLRGALKAPPRPVHHLALPKDAVGEFLSKLHEYDGELETRLAIKLAMLTVVRTKELRAAEWREFEHLDDANRALWRVPAERMKMREVHLVPLPRQAIQRLSELRELSGRSKFLFPSRGREGFMSNNTMLYGLYRLGYHGRTTTHGFRRLFSTEANENGFEADWVERQLAHDERNKVRSAYNAAQYLPQRREMLQWWADHLDKLQADHRHGRAQ